MSAQSPFVVTYPAAERAILGTSGIFFVNGAMIGSLSTHFAVMKARLGVDPATFSMVLMSMAVGAIVMMSLSSLLLRRFGSAPVVLATALMTPLMFILPVVADGPILTALALFFLGASNGLMDASMNVHASAGERAAGRLAMARIHAMWSFGGILGSVAAGYALSRISALSHAGLQAALLMGAALLFCRLILPAAADRGREGQHLSLPSKALLPVAAMAFLLLFCGAAVRDWSAVYLTERFEADYATASWGFAAFSAATAAGRIFGDRLRHLIGDRQLLVLGGLAGAVALVLGLTSPTQLLTILALGALGLAHSVLTPLLFSVAGQERTGLPAANISAVMTIGFTGYVAGPPVIGFVASQSSLAVGLSSAAAASALVALIAYLSRR